MPRILTIPWSGGQALGLGASDTSIYLPPTAPQVAVGQSFLDPTFGYRVYVLGGGTTGARNSYAYWPALNQDNSILLIRIDGTNLLYDIAFTTTTVAVSNPRDPFGGIGGQWEGLIWDRTDRTVHYFLLNSTVQAKLYTRNVVTGVNTLLKDFLADTRFTAVFPTAGYVWQLRSDKFQNRFTATARKSDGTYLGEWVWDKTTDALWAFSDPGIDESALSLDGAYMVAVYGSAGYATVRLSDSHVSFFVTDSGHGDEGNTLRYRTQDGLYSLPLDPTGPQVTIIPETLKNGKTDPYDDAHTSNQPDDGWVYSSSYHGLSPVGAVWSPFTFPDGFSSPTYAMDWNAYVLAHPQADFPVNHVRANSVRLSAYLGGQFTPGTFYYDVASKDLFVRLAGDVNPNTKNMYLTDWRPLLEECVAYKTDSSAVRRFCHTHSSADVYETSVFAAPSYDGKYMVFASDWDGAVPGGAPFGVFIVQLY